MIPEVLEWHSHLRRYIRLVDQITGPILDLIDQHLLQVDPALRPSASELHNYLLQILHRAEEATQLSTNEAATIEALAGENEVGLHEVSPPATPGFPIELFDTPCDFWDSAIGMGTLDEFDLPDLHGLTPLRCDVHIKLAFSV